MRRFAFENGLSLFFALLILATVWLVQKASKASNESKRLEDAGLESDRAQKVGRYAPDDAPRPAKWTKAALLVRELAPARDGDDLPALLEAVSR